MVPPRRPRETLGLSTLAAFEPQNLRLGRLRGTVALDDDDDDKVTDDEDVLDDENLLDFEALWSDSSRVASHCARAISCATI
mmetsp:Transcript_13903/g.30380  ORF Transcript_13903/g.30380 Transcript_13903/m.30380 type:complete len:82 (+) Transcript_13903:87-332(+)